MKKLKLLTLSSLAFLSTVPVFAQDADEIISKYISAIGGATNWGKVNTIYYEGNFEAHGTKVQIYKTIWNNKGMRLNMIAPQINAFEIVTPAEGWEFKPFLGQDKPVALTRERLAKDADQYDAQGIFIDYKAKGHRMEYAGTATINGKQCYKIDVTHKSGKFETVYFDATSYFLIRSVGNLPGMGDVVTDFDQYTLLPEGIWFPMSISTNPGTGDVIISKIEINKSVKETIFKPVN